MPELPDVTVYIEALSQRIRGARLEKVRLFNPFLLRTAVPPIASSEGKRVTGLRRLGKRVVIELEGELFLVLHLMIAGRLHWEGRKTRSTLALFEFDAASGARRCICSRAKRRCARWTPAASRSSNPTWASSAQS
jgi:formamidopyrimidine-DNA glycosylase